ncbi:MAG: chromo domain-containing protein, partial [Candidatus Thiodiazotropha endolucinida]
NKQPPGPVQLEMSGSQKGNKQPPNPVQLELSGSQERKEQPSSPNTASKQNDTNIKRVPVRILRHKTVNKEKQYCVRWKDSWELGENLSKLREIFPHRVLKRKRTNNIQYCLVRWRDSWEPAKKCSDEDIQKYNIARANERRKKKPQPQPRHEHFLRSTIKQNGQD